MFPQRGLQLKIFSFLIFDSYPLISKQRIKFKFADYLNLMISGKFDLKYAMNHAVAGDLMEKVALLDEENIATALQMLGKILLYASAGKTPQERWRSLYNIVPPEERTPYFKGRCRLFVQSFSD